MNDNPLVIATELRREPGSSRTLDLNVALEHSLGTEVIGIPAGESVHLNLLLESVVDGILVSGSIDGALTGECVRCLGPLQEEFTAEVTELYAYPEAIEESDDEEEDPPAMVVDDTIDLTDLLVDAVVADLPFNPLCAPDCLGLCPECGINLNENPDHEHAAPIDSRWAALSELASSDGD